MPGRLRQAVLKPDHASGVIPQITAIFGTCGGGMAVSAGITDFTFMEEKSGKLFVNSPNAIDGNYKEKCDTSSADSRAGNPDWQISQEMSLPLSLRSAPWFPFFRPTTRMICHTESARMT